MSTGSPTGAFAALIPKNARYKKETALDANNAKLKDLLIVET